MSKIIQEILAEVFPGEETASYAPRMEMLYGMVFDLAKPAEHPRLKGEIVACEHFFARNTRLEAKDHDAMTPEMAVRMFSGIAFRLAEVRFQTGKTQLCAVYLEKVFSGLLDSGLVSKQVQETCRMDISDALVDYNYAAGFSENLSFRLHAFVK